MLALRRMWLWLVWGVAALPGSSEPAPADIIRQSGAVAVGHALVDVDNAASQCARGEGRVSAGGCAAELLRGQGPTQGHRHLQLHLHRSARRVIDQESKIHE